MTPDFPREIKNTAQSEGLHSGEISEGLSSMHFNPRSYGGTWKGPLSAAFPTSPE